jgi:hypothetical protein
MRSSLASGDGGAAGCTGQPFHLEIAMQQDAPTPGPSLPNPTSPSSSLIFSFTTAERVPSDPRSLPMPHRQQQQAMAVAPNGCVTVRVGTEGEELWRFAVPLGTSSTRALCVAARGGGAGVRLQAPGCHGRRPTPIRRGSGRLRR